LALWKRSLDLSCILIGLPVILPLMALIVLWIKLVSRGPAIFRQVRIGRDGKPFTLYKFRSMHLHADTRRHARHFSHLVESNSPMVKLDLLCDSRLIPGGCLLRAAGLDELPQLLNVLRGEMSLVGPRPCLPEEYGYFTRGQRVRFRALPGLTGIWQTQGKGISTFTEMNAMDADYVRKASLLLDLSIIWRTPCAILSQLRMAWTRRRISSGRKAIRPSMESKPAQALATQRLG
jgi:lipopolysaccharide/colanic/teichoic acid biosynthesis glycosyltransferase